MIKKSAFVFCEVQFEHVNIGDGRLVVRKERSAVYCYNNCILNVLLRICVLGFFYP